MVGSGLQAHAFEMECVLPDVVEILGDWRHFKSLRLQVLII